MKDIYDKLDIQLHIARNWESELKSPIDEAGGTVDLFKYRYLNSCLIAVPEYPKGCLFWFDPLKYHAHMPGAGEKLSADIQDGAINSGFELCESSCSNKNVKSYKRSIDFYRGQYFINDSRTK